MPIRLTPTNEELDQPLAEPSASSTSESQLGSESNPGDSGAASEPSTNGSSAVAAFRRSRYEEYDHTDLLHVIDELEGSRNWVSLREKLWIALIIHMLIAWYLLYGPRS